MRPSRLSVGPGVPGGKRRRVGLAGRSVPELASAPLCAAGFAARVSTAPSTAACAFDGAEAFRRERAADGGASGVVTFKTSGDGTAAEAAAAGPGGAAGAGVGAAWVTSGAGPARFGPFI